MSDAQVEQYGTKSGPMGPDAAQQIETHLDGCPACRDRLLLSQRVHFAVADMGDSPVNTSPGPNCPEEGALRNLAAGLCPPSQAAALTGHAAQCNHCGPLLRMYSEDFSEELSKEDAAVLGKLKSSSAGWQKKLVSQIFAASSAPPATSAGKSWLWNRWVWTPAAATACAAIAFTVWYAQRDTPEKVEKLLAQTYTEDRKLEMRIPYAEHADFHQVRSGEAESRLSSPESLRKATDKIAAQLKKNPDDPVWLLLGARLDLLDWHYKPALSRLDRIGGAAADSPEMRMTRALALYEKAETEHVPQAYGEVVDLLGKTLQKTPDDPLALFNQAIACEKLHMFECATGDYEHFLTVEKDPAWAAEAQDHLKRIQEKKTPGS